MSTEQPTAAPKVAPSLPLLENNLYRVIVRGIHSGQQTANVFYWRDDKATAIAGPALMQELMDELVDAPGGFLDTYCQCIAEPWGPPVTVIIDLPMDERVQPLVKEKGKSGQVVGTALPTQMAVTIARYSTIRGRKGRSRISMPAVPESFITGGKLSDTSSYEALCIFLRNPSVTPSGVFTPVCFSPGNLTFQTAGAAPIYKTIVRDVLGTCRRRKIGVGI